MIDIHNHILFDIDDGAEDIDTCVEMCIDAYKNGCTAIAVTPHFFKYNKLDDFVYERTQKVKTLRHILEKENIDLLVFSGAELFLSDKIFDAENLDALTINHSRYMLCEFPLGPFDVNRVPLWIDELISRGYTPIVAHPERYVELHRNFHIIDELIDRDVVFQVNIDSLTGSNGPEPQGMAIDMVRRKIAKLIATDAHDLEYRHTRIKDKFKKLPDVITEEMLDFCMNEIPDRILKNKEI